jgi:hypothetical protein
LNVFWPKLGPQTAELFFGYVQRFNSLDLQNHENGTALDELNAHRFLEALGEAMTVVEMRQYLRSTGALGEGRPKNFPITHFLMAKYKGDWRILVNASQGDNAEEIARAQTMLNEATAAMHDAQRAADESTRAADEVRREQSIYDNRTADLTAKSQSGGVVSQNRAKAELAQHLAADPLPLSRAKITAEAAEKRAAKALALAQQRVTELEAYLAELAAKSGSSAGSLWWIERELHEQKKYMPKARGGIDK